MKSSPKYRFTADQKFDMSLERERIRITALSWHGRTRLDEALGPPYPVEWVLRSLRWTPAPVLGLSDET